MKFKIKESNVEISMFNQHKTYDTFSYGLPNDEINFQLINKAVDEANLRLFPSINKNIPITLVNPKIEFCTHKYEASSLAPLGEEIVHYPRLPEYITTILVEDYFQQAIVVLFTNNMADLVEVRELVKDLDWSQISEETK